MAGGRTLTATDAQGVGPVAAAKFGQTRGSGGKAERLEIPAELKLRMGARQPLPGPVRLQVWGRMADGHARAADQQQGVDVPEAVHLGRPRGGHGGRNEKRAQPAPEQNLEQHNRHLRSYST